MKARVGLLASAIAMTLATFAISAPANAGDKHRRHKHRAVYSGVEYARVVDVDPIVRRVRVSAPERECWNESEPVRTHSRTEVRSTLIGGLIGAAVGHRVSGRHDISTPVAVVGGAAIGAAVGNGIGERRADRNGHYETGYRSVQRCEVGYRDVWEEHIEGYRVTYLYHGREFTSMMPYDPGDRVRVNVDVSPQYVGYYR